MLFASAPDGWGRGGGLGGRHEVLITAGVGDRDLLVTVDPALHALSPTLPVVGIRAAQGRFSRSLPPPSKEHPKHMTGGDIAGLIAAGVFAVLVVLLAVPILKLGRVFDELRILIRDLNDETEPLLEEVTRTVATTNSQLEKVDVITDSVSDASASMSAMTSLVASTVGQPIIKTAAFSSGVRRAFSGDAVRARREERRRAREAEQAARPATAEDRSPAGAAADQDLSARGAEQPKGGPGRAAAAHGMPVSAQDGPWWKGTEWDAERSADTTASAASPVQADRDETRSAQPAEGSAARFASEQGDPSQRRDAEGPHA